jgi:hypothetical protein
MKYTHTYRIGYKDALDLFLTLTKDTTVKPFSWEIMRRADYTNYTRIFEGALDYGIGMSFIALIRMYKNTGKRPTEIQFAFHSKGCDILSKSGKLLIGDK